MRHCIMRLTLKVRRPTYHGKVYHIMHAVVEDLRPRKSQPAVVSARAKETPPSPNLLFASALLAFVLSRLDLDLFGRRIDHSRRHLVSSFSVSPRGIQSCGLSVSWCFFA